MRHRRDMGDHVGCVAAVAGHATDFVHILADEGIVAPTLAAIAARAAKPADARSRAHLPAMDALAKRVDDADHLMPRHARILHDREETLHRHDIAVTNAASLDANANFLGTRDGNVPLFRHEPPAPLLDDHCAHLRHYRISFGRDETIEPIGSGRSAYHPAPGSSSQ